MRSLNSNKIEYLLIGGYAVAYHGYTRATADMDIWIAADAENARKLVKLIKEFGFDVPELIPSLFLEKNKVIRMGVPPVRIELITNIDGVSFEECYASRIEDNIDGVMVDLIDLDHLKINKRASGRYKDLNDLEHLP